jgi:hypothetical protein
MIIPPLFYAFFIKPFVEKMTYIGLVLYALRYKENVATEYTHGSFKLVATGSAAPKKLP